MQVQSSTSRATLSMFGFQMIQWGSIITKIIPVIVTDAEIQVNKIVFMWTMLGNGYPENRSTQGNE